MAGIPVIVGGTVLVGAVMGIVFLKESVSLIQLAGVAILASHAA